ncbi:MAG: hypothetical protein U1F47_10590 [Hyphomicrobiales bacterium]
MMRNLVWIATAAVIALWSGAAWLLHAAIGLGGSLAATHADLIPATPELVEWASWLALFGTGVGEWLVIAIWAVVSATLLTLGFVATRLMPRLTRGVTAH